LEEFGAVKTVAVVGASPDRSKFGNKALRAFAAQGYRVVAVHPSAAEVEGVKTYPRVADVPFALDMATLYVPPSIGIGLIDDLAAAGVKEVWLNPGSESPALIARARELGLDPIVACSILGIGESPGDY
jgi:hypothetical protein